MLLVLYCYLNIEVSPIALLGQGLSTSQKIDNYKAIFVKQDSVNGKLKEAETIIVKFKKPFKLYLKWTAGVKKDREVLYVEGENDNKLKVHLEGLLGMFIPSIDVALDDPRLKAESNRSIKDITLENLMTLLLQQYKIAEKDEECKFKFHGTQKIGEFNTYSFERICPEKPEYQSYRAFINLDKESGIPVRVILYDWHNKITAIYMFQYLKLDAGLTNYDFNSKNKDYKF